MIDNKTENDMPMCVETKSVVKVEPHNESEASVVDDSTTDSHCDESVIEQNVTKEKCMQSSHQQYADLYEGLDDNLSASFSVEDDHIFEAPDIYESSNYKYDNLDDMDEGKSESRPIEDRLNFVDRLLSSNSHKESPENSQPRKRLFAEIDGNKNIEKKFCESETDLEEGELADNDFSGSKVKCSKGSLLKGSLGRKASASGTVPSKMWKCLPIQMMNY